MTIDSPFRELAFGQVFETLLPDFVLAFTFFTALSYAVLSRRLERQRPAVAASASIGLALAIGLVWWEERAGLSIRDLGPFAVGFGIILVALVMYQAIRHVGGSWAGAGIAMGAALLIAQLLELPWPVRVEVLQTVTTVVLIFGILAFLTHRGLHSRGLPAIRSNLAPVRHDMRDLEKAKGVSRQLARGLRRTKREADRLHEHPEKAGDVLYQIKRMLPAEGYLTERMAGLRGSAHRIRKGHIARIEETRDLIKDLSPKDKRKVSQELVERYQELGLDKRIERLDLWVAENEQKIRRLTAEAEGHMARYDYRGLHDCLKAAEALQKRNSRIFQLIERTEKRLLALSKQIAKGAGGVKAP